MSGFLSSRLPLRDRWRIYAASVYKVLRQLVGHLLTFAVAAWQRASLYFGYFWQRIRRARAGELLVDGHTLAPRQFLIVTLLSRYVQYFHLAILAGFFYLLVYLLFTRVPPDQVADWPLPDMYLPAQLLLFAGNFFAGVYILLNRRAGLWWAMSVWFYLFWRFGHFAWTLPIKIAVVSWSVFWFWYLLIRQKTALSPERTQAQTPANSSSVRHTV